MGERKGRGGGNIYKENRTLRRIQHLIDTTSAELLRCKNPTTRTQLLKKVKKFQRKKVEHTRKYKKKQYENFLDKLESLDTQNRMLAFWDEVKSTLGGKSKDQIGVIRNNDGELSNSKESFLENWAAFYENLYSANRVGNSSL